MSAQSWWMAGNREMLVAVGVLPLRQENLARLELWLSGIVKQLPPHQARIIRPFAEWSIVRDARRRAARSRYTAGAAAMNRAHIRVAIEFLAWLDTHQLPLSALGQEDLDLWLTTHPTRRRGLGAFIRWAVARRLTGKLTIPGRPSSTPSQFLGSQELHEQLGRCLNDLDAVQGEHGVSGSGCPEPGGEEHGSVDPKTVGVQGRTGHVLQPGRSPCGSASMSWGPRTRSRPAPPGRCECCPRTASRPRRSARHRPGPASRRRGPRRAATAPTHRLPSEHAGLPHRTTASSRHKAPPSRRPGVPRA